MIISAWAKRHNIPSAAVTELRTLLIGDDAAYGVSAKEGSETAVQNDIRMTAAKMGGRLFRNNVGAGHVAESGSFMRWGLCNDSAALNAQVKSADLIGILPVRITEEHVGSLLGQFWSVECKRPGWRYAGTDRERAQLRWSEIINGLGGRAEFSTGGLGK
jgi:hypothetical protein